MTQRTAAKTKKALRKKLIRLAHNNPEKRAEILPVLAKMGVDLSKFAKKGDKMPAKMPAEVLEGFKDKEDKEAAIKVAGKDTEEFVRWVMSTQSPMSPNEVESFVSRTLGIKTSAPQKRRTGPRFQKGDQVLVCASKHKGKGVGTYKLYDNKIGTCVGSDGDDLLLAIKGEPAPIRFEQGMKARGVGVYKYTGAYTITGSAGMEMLYFAGGKSTSDTKIVVDAYIGRGGKKEKRSANYYSGHVVLASTGSKGYYFRGFPQQRMAVPGKTCAGDSFFPRSFNPSVGQVFYMGVQGHRPAKWKDDLAQLDKQAEAAGG